jgi:hypothetical protein
MFLLQQGPARPRGARFSVSSWSSPFRLAAQAHFAAAHLEPLCQHAKRDLPVTIPPVALPAQ